MSRDDSVLFSGATSASFGSAKEREVKAKAQERKEKRDETTAALKPVAQNVLDTVDIERDKTVAQMLSLVTPGTPDKDVKALVVSLNLYKASCDHLKSQLRVVLKDVS